MMCGANSLPEEFFASVIISMQRIKSSWNEDRVASSFCNRRHSKKNGPRPSALFAEYKLNTDKVTVFTRRGREVFVRRFGDVIRSARIEGDDLKVETVNGSRYMCDAVTGELLEAWPAAETAAEPASPEMPMSSDVPAGIIAAA